MVKLDSQKQCYHGRKSYREDQVIQVMSENYQKGKYSGNPVLGSSTQNFWVTSEWLLDLRNTEISIWPRRRIYLPFHPERKICSHAERWCAQSHCRSFSHMNVHIAQFRWLEARSWGGKKVRIQRRFRLWKFLALLACAGLLVVHLNSLAKLSILGNSSNSSLPF